MESSAIKEEKTTTKYTTWSLINIFNNVFKIKEEGAIIEITGVYLQAQISKSYNGYFYDKLGDEKSSHTLPLKINEVDRSLLQNGCVIDLKGFITRRLDEKGTFNVIVNVVEIMGKAQAAHSEADLMAFAIMQRKANKGFRDVEGLLNKFIIVGKKPVINIYVGHTAIIDKDIIHGMGEAITFFEPKFIKINLSNPEAIVSALDDHVADIVVIARGGGSGLDVFNDVSVLDAALNSKSVVLTAIGHKEDHTLLDNISDKRFVTPTDLGNFFRQTYNKVVEQVNNSRAKLIEQTVSVVKREFIDKITLQEKLLTERTAQVEELKSNQEKLLKERTDQIEELKFNQQKLLEFKQAQVEELKSSQPGIRTVIIYVIIGIVIGALLVIAFR
jgi:ElaB/YqjD/DUF883 family membrane-anchored ribosome-binding protein